MLATLLLHLTPKVSPPTLPPLLTLLLLPNKAVRMQRTLGMGRQLLRELPVLLQFRLMEVMAPKHPVRMISPVVTHQLVMERRLLNRHLSQVVLLLLLGATVLPLPRVVTEGLHPTAIVYPLQTPMDLRGLLVDTRPFRLVTVHHMEDLGVVTAMGKAVVAEAMEEVVSTVEAVTTEEKVRWLRRKTPSSSPG